MILFDDITVMGEGGVFLPHAFVCVEGAVIKSVSSERPQGSYDRIVQGKDRLLLPGFFNAHTHSPMMLMRGYGENMKLDSWLNEKIFPYEDKLTGDAVYAATMLAMAESFQNGIVSSTEMYYFCDDIVRAVIETGAKMNIARALVMFDSKADPTKDVRYLEAVDVYNKYNGAEDGRILVDYAIHAEYSSTPALVRATAELAKSSNTGIQIHVSETKGEHEKCKVKYNGLTPIQYFADLGLFDVPVTAAHCVWIEEVDRQILKEKSATVATCPISNLKLSSGVCDIPALLSAGIGTAIGTDSVASNNSLNIIEEMKFFALLSKERSGDPSVISPAEAIHAATLAGAVSQRRGDCGEIKAGNRADIVLIDTSGPNMVPVYDEAVNIVYSASGGDVALTMIDGRIVYENGEYLTLDIEKVKAEAQSAAMKIAAEV